MEKSIELYIDIDGNPVGFPQGKEQIEISAFTADYKRMGHAPTITCTVKYPTCLDNEWTYGVYTKFNNERFYLKHIPSSSFSNKDARYIHELELCSERVQLDNVFVFDVVSNDTKADRPVSNNTNFSFFGTIEEFAQRLNYSLVYTKLQVVNENGEVSGYRVVVDEGISSEGKLVSIDNKVFSEVLHEAFNTYEIPYYFVGKVIHLGHAPNTIEEETFKYGAKNSLLSIKKENAKTKVINRITGTGSEDNIPYYYPNKTSLGDVYLTYNDEENKAVIGDQAKFSKNKLSNVFHYHHSEGSNTYIKGEEWEVNQVYPTDSSKTNHVCSKTIKLYKTSTVGEFRINLLFTSWGASESEVPLFVLVNKQDDSVVEEWKADYTTNEFDLNVGNQTSNVTMFYWSTNKTFHTLQSGDYEFSVRCLINTNGSDTAKEIFESTYIFSFEYYIPETKYWLLENKAISSLSDYGITTLGEPKDGDTIKIEQNTQTWLVPQKKLMPPIYRETSGAERFYNAENGTYDNPETGKKYTFTNVYVEGNPREHIAEFEDIKPSIVGVTNKKGDLINSFIEFAYDDKDNDEKDEEGKFIHPYFFAKLRKFNGDNGFNLFHHAIESGEMTISMTSGNCGGCQWVIGVDADGKFNPVQVNEDGSLKRNEDGDIICGREGQAKQQPQERQQDTINNEVWIALLKDNQTFHTVMPNKTNNYRPAVGDEFVILNIHLPHAYITASEKRLEEELIRYMADNNNEKFKFSIDFSKVYFAEHEDVLEKLNENSRLKISYNNSDPISLYVSSFSYSIKENSAYPDIKVELSEDITISSNAIQQAVTQVEAQLSNKISNLDILALASPYFHRKDIQDQTNVPQSFTEGIKVGKNKEFGFSGDGIVTADGFKTKDFEKGFVGAGIYKDETGAVAEVDYLNVRKKATFKEVEIQETKHIGGKLELTAAECKCETVEYLKDEAGNIVAFKVYFRRYSGENELITNKWQVGDQARCDTFNLEQNKDGSQGNRYYWRLVTEVGTGGYALDNKSMAEYHWIVLSNKKSETITLNGNTIENTDGFDEGSSFPLSGDSIIQLGNRFGTDGRVSAIELAGAGTDSPYIRQYENITDFDLPTPDTQIKPGNNLFTGKVTIQHGSKGLGEFSDLPDAVNDVVMVGGENLIKNSGFIGEYESVDPSEAKLETGTVLYNEPMKFWTIIASASSVDEARAVSGKACKFGPIGSKISQDIQLEDNEIYTLSVVTDGDLKVIYNNIETKINSNENKRQKILIEGNGELSTITFVNLTVNAKIWDLKLEKGKVSTDWCPSVNDTDPVANRFSNLWYLQDALRNGQTEILGGLLLSQMIQCGTFRNGEMQSITAGISGIMNDGEDVAFWAGGDYSAAVETMNKLHSGNNLTDSEWNALVGFAATHGGDMFLKGYVYASGGVFRGTVYANGGVFKGDVQAKRLVVTRFDNEYDKTTESLLVDGAYITGRGNYKLPELEEGQMVTIRWFNPSYTAKATATTVFEGATTNVLIANSSTNGFYGKITFAYPKTMYDIIGDHPFSNDVSENLKGKTLWSFIPLGSTTTSDDADFPSFGPIIPFPGKQ